MSQVGGDKPSDGMGPRRPLPNRVVERLNEIIRKDSEQCPVHSKR